MLKEIYEQPEALANAMRGRLDDADATAHFGGLNLDAAATAADRSRHHDRVRHELPRRRWSASTCSRNSPACRSRSSTPASSATATRRSTATPSCSPSRSRGETADTLAALRESKRMGHTTLAICNAVGSSIAREADGGVYLHAGPEIGVASTKAFTSQVHRADDARPVLRPHAAPVEHPGPAHHRGTAARCRTRFARRSSATTG